MTEHVSKTLDFYYETVNYSKGEKVGTHRTQWFEVDIPRSPLNDSKLIVFDQDGLMVTLLLHQRILEGAVPKEAARPSLIAKSIGHGTLLQANGGIYWVLGAGFLLCPAKKDRDRWQSDDKKRFARFERIVNKVPLALAWTDDGELVNGSKPLKDVVGSWALIDLRAEEHLRVAAVLTDEDVGLFCDTAVQGKKHEPMRSADLIATIHAWSLLEPRQMQKKLEANFTGIDTCDVKYNKQANQKWLSPINKQKFLNQRPTAAKVCCFTGAGPLEDVYLISEWADPPCTRQSFMTGTYDFTRWIAFDKPTPSERKLRLIQTTASLLLLSFQAVLSLSLSPYPTPLGRRAKG